MSYDPIYIIYSPRYSSAFGMAFSRDVLGTQDPCVLLEYDYYGSSDTHDRPYTSWLFPVIPEHSAMDSADKDYLQRMLEMVYEEVEDACKSAASDRLLWWVPLRNVAGSWLIFRSSARA